MKHGISELGNKNTNTAKTKKQKISKSLEDLLIEVSQGQYEEFREWLAQNKIQKLELYRKARNVDLRHLGLALQDTSLTTLELDNNEIDDEGAEDLGLALANNMTLTTLDLGANNIGPKGAKNLVLALANNTTLTTLSLMMNQIGDEEATDLSLVLANNTTFTSLNLGGNKINNTGAKALGLVLTNNKYLTYLNLSGNLIGDEGAEDLGLALANNTTLTTLNLWNNQIGPQGAKSLVSALANNTTLTTLDLAPIKIDLLPAVEELAPLIARTCLLKVYLGFNHPKLQEALEFNHQKIVFTPYCAAWLQYLPAKEKPQYQNLPKLSSDPSHEEELRYAGGILMHPFLPQELTENILSFLPFMNTKVWRKTPYVGKVERVQNYCKQASDYHFSGLEIGYEPKCESMDTTTKKVRSQII